MIRPQCDTSSNDDLALKEDWRDDFEKIFPIPAGMERTSSYGDGISPGYINKFCCIQLAAIHMHRWAGYKTGREALLAERTADKALIADLQRKLEEETMRANRADFEGYSRAVREYGSRTVSVKLPPLDDDLISILGRPNFTCSHLAEILRKGGQDIPRKSDHEQAAVIYWFLGLYLEHGDKWESIAKYDIQSRVAGIKLEVGE